MRTRRDLHQTGLTPENDVEDGADISHAHRAVLNAAMGRYVQGENEDFPTVYRLLAPRLRGLLLSRGCSRAVADDVLQDTFLRIHLARGRYGSERDVVPWVISIVRRLFVDQWRRGRRECLEETGLDTRCIATTPEHDVIAVEVSTRLLEAIRGLPLTQQRAFELVRLKGRSITQTASLLGTTPSGVKLRLHRADLALRGAVSGRQTRRSPGPRAETTLRAATKSIGLARIPQKL